MNLNELTKPTKILDFNSPNIAKLIADKGWKNMPQEQAAREIYEFCRDEIRFGYNAEADDMPASAVLEEGLGHCNTKSTLFMALFRAIGIPCRLHGFTIDKVLQKGAMTGFVYLLAPRDIIHTWVEAYFNDRWITLEGLILDEEYLQSIRRAYPGCKHPFLGYAVATKNLQNPQEAWTGGDTFIQSEGITRELGVYDSPDDFYKNHKTNLTGLRKILFQWFLYKPLNEHIEKLRKGDVPRNDHDCCGPDKKI